MTEASHQIACAPLPPRQRKPGSVGVPAGTRVAIRDGDGTFLGPDRIGEILTRGEGVTTGYANSPEANAEAFSDGWFRTGDQGLIDKEGYIFITGRTREIIDRGGTKISPREIEDVLMGHPAVAEAVAFAVPDPRLGEDVGAAVVVREGASVDERGLRNFAAVRLADFKLPRRIVFLDEVPKGPTGKPQRIGLAAKLGIGQPAKEAMPFVAPGTPMEMELAALWRRTLRVERIGIHEDFFDAGGDSLCAVCLLAEIEQVMGTQLSIGDLFEAPTIARLALLLSDNPAAHDCPDLVAIQPAGSRPPFFCIFAGPLFRELARRLGPDQPFLSPQYPALDELPHPCRLEDLAAAHVETIRAAQREEPYFLSGWCVDGVVAYEVARQLRAQGQQVGLLVLFDVPNPALANQASKVRDMAAAGRRLAWRLRRHLLALRQHRWREAPAYILERVPPLVARVRRKGVQLDYMIRLRLRMPAIARNERAIHYRAAALYRPGPYDGRMLLLRRTLRHEGEEAADSGWDELALGGLDVQEIPGDHSDMFLEPYVAITARKLGASLWDAQGDLASEAPAVGIPPEGVKVSHLVAQAPSRPG
jgi:thioesterase domain-containing protein/acyl carrier protein